MESDDHIKNLGKLIASLQSFELLIRVHLSSRPNNVNSQNKDDIYTLPVGAKVIESDITNFKNLCELIKEFNKEAEFEKRDEIDLQIIRVRDALAHGRVFTREKKFPLRLIKFSKPRSGNVHIDYSEEMSEMWFKNQIRLVNKAIKIVLNVTNHN